MLGIALSPFMSLREFKLTAREIADWVSNAPDSVSALALTQDALLYYILPSLLVLAFIAVVLGLSYLLVATVTATLVPRRWRGYVDGMIFAATLFLAVMAAEIFSTNMTPFIVFVLFQALTLPALWARVPVSLTYHGTAQLDVPLPVNEAKRHFFPNCDPGVELADAAWINEANMHVFGADTRLPLKVQSLGDNAIRVTDPPVAPGRAYRYVDLRLVPLNDNRARLHLDVTILRAAPYDFWDFWTRPYAEDYADYLHNRITGEKDRTVYGALLKRYLKRAKRAAAPATMRPA